MSKLKSLRRNIRNIAARVVHHRFTTTVATLAVQHAHAEWAPLVAPTLALLRVALPRSE